VLVVRVSFRVFKRRFIVRRRVLSRNNPSRR
jgi:hypothetical protein